MPNAAQPPTAPLDAAQRRAKFPRGLIQPEGGFRFGADTLLLAAFAAARLKAPRSGHAGPSGLDLGCGCGAASIGLLLLAPTARLTGIDADPAMADAARRNAHALDLHARLDIVQGDVADHHAPAGLDFALANPPFRKHGTGRACPDPARDRARFEGPGGFAAFAACAAHRLRRGGTLFLVHLAERLPDILGELTAAGLAARELLPVQGHVDADPRLILLAANKGGSPTLALRRPLTLYDADGMLTPEAAIFCPHLTTNPRRGGPK